MKIPLVILLLFFLFSSCSEKNPNVKNSGTPDKKSDTPDSIDWSTVTPDLAWETISSLYKSDGPQAAIDYLDNARKAGVIDYLEAEQVRAGLLYDAGRIDDAFLSLANFSIDTSRPDLLKLRADVLYSMCRYDESVRDFQSLKTIPDYPEIDYVNTSLFRLYDDIGNFNERDKIYSELKNSPSIVEIDFLRASLDTEYESMKEFATKWGQKNQIPDTNNPLLIISYASEKIAYGKNSDAVKILREYLENNDLNINIALMLLEQDIELNDFDSFKSDIRKSLKYFKAEAYYDYSSAQVPPLIENPIEVSSLLVPAAVLELGFGRLDTSDLLLKRAIILNPYNYQAILAQAAVFLCRYDNQGAIDKLSEASKLAPPSDMRVLIRQLQYPKFSKEPLEIPWDENEIKSRFQKIFKVRSSEWLHNSFIDAINAEWYALNGNFETALELSGYKSSSAPVSRDRMLRRAYYLAKFGKLDEAIESAKSVLPKGSPYILWFVMMSQEAYASDDKNLWELADTVRKYTDPNYKLNPFFME